MNNQGIELRTDSDISLSSLLGLYEAVGWAAYTREERRGDLEKAIENSSFVVSAWWEGDTLIDLARALSDDVSIVYLQDVLVHPNYQRRGIGRRIVEKLLARYRDMHQHVLMADGDAIAFYERCGFVRAGRTQSMWIYAGTDH